ncbi:hypothetical protein QE152_g38158 [Popillia japonica]|uniref:Retrotransposon gag domain-containing protein n=1 Tax=Popillia japonica TaxID=7064 RepID=A0AAW1I7T3_POPJA
MEYVKQPREMSMDGDLGLNWKKFKARFEIYIKATGINNKGTEENRIACLLHCMGEDAQEIFETFELSEQKKESYKEVVKAFEDYFVPKSNPSVERHKFNTRIQRPGENFDTFLGELKKLAANCEFAQMKDELIKDRIV